jgi:hypothetical protein
MVKNNNTSDESKKVNHKEYSGDTFSGGREALEKMKQEKRAEIMEKVNKELESYTGGVLAIAFEAKDNTTCSIIIGAGNVMSYAGIGIELQKLENRLRHECIDLLSHAVNHKNANANSNDPLEQIRRAQFK